MMTQTRRVLVAEDEAPLRDFIGRNLRARGFQVIEATDGLEALQRWEAESPHLLVLDIMMPRMDGLEVCRTIRERSTVPIIVLTALDAESDKVNALDQGADDYLTKPFGIGELLARVRALLRRSEGSVPADQVIEVGPLAVDLPHRLVTVNGGDEVHLTPTEFDLLKQFALADGRPLTHQMLLRSVWGPGYATETQLLRTHMGRLRDKLESHGVPRRTIETLTGIGYRLRDEAGGAVAS
jgi:two-component system KDP operon response regulator KdpE